ncbi:phage Gp37/Gp68 family protein [Martelella soudanensis]|uniref:phage Gp37/Gp68 family protein n=1 Tax=unclassified Martelella TaxID=2629616 RepID=UPI0015DFB37C|nr:phage Gp37/Gp68 family protein [Martelella sp. NC18]
MSDNTKIEWTDATWNIVTGCSVVSPGCTNCYAMRLAGTRLKHHESRKGLTRETKAGPVWTGEVRFNQQWLTQPLAWKRPRHIFVAAHGDLFADGVTDEQLDRIFAVMALSPRHTFQVLTKRPERMRDYLRPARSHPVALEALHITLMSHFLDHNSKVGEGCLIEGDMAHLSTWPLPNIWLGVSVEDQTRADQRIPVLLATPAALRWISAEPLLGGLRLSGTSADKQNMWDWLQGLDARMYPDGPDFDYGPKLDWIVAGGESGPNARPMHPDWVRSLRDQCAAAEVPFNFKQWGEWWEVASDARDDDGNHLTCYTDSIEATEMFDQASDCLLTADGRRFTIDDLPPETPGRHMTRIGKKAAGRLLDGVLHDAFPELRP